MAIPLAIRGMAFANGQGIVACLPFPVNSHSIPIPSKFLRRGGGHHPSHDFPAKIAFPYHGVGSQFDAVAGLFLMQLGFEKMKTFSSNVVFQFFSLSMFNSVDLEKPKEFPKIPRFLRGFKRGLDFSWFFFEKSCTNLVNQHLFL